MGKENWKDEVMNSLHGLQSAEPNAFLFTRIEAKLETATGLTKHQVRLAGVCLVLLLAINIWVAGISNSTAENQNSLTTTYRY